MEEKIFIEIGLIFILGIGAQWVGWRLKIPSIILLLTGGFLAGPVLNLIHPDHLFGELLLPFVSISVAIILFEGGLSLQLKEFREIGGSLLSLVSLGSAVTWIGVTLAAYYILGINFKISLLIGAILVVTGPTVITPLLHHIKPSARVSELLKWEGIVIDPIGALLAVLVFDVIELGTLGNATQTVIFAIGKTVLVSIGVSVFFSWVLYSFLKKYWIPEYLEESITLTAVITAFILSNHIQPESGLFTATFMGLLLGNQKKVSISRIVQFKENLVVLMISLLFVILAARFKLEDIQLIHLGFIPFLLLLLLIIRPISVFISTLFSDISLKEKLFVSWMAPRGIVAAAVSSVFAFKLASIKVEGTEFIVPVVFGVIVATVSIYGLTAPLLAKLLHLSQSNPQGVLFVGAHKASIQIALALKEHGFSSVLVDTNPEHVLQAKLQGLKAYTGNILSDRLIEKIDLTGIGKLFAMTPNDEANSLAVVHMKEFFEKQNLFQLFPIKIADKKEKKDELALDLKGRFLFGNGVTYDKIIEFINEGYTIKISNITSEFSLNDFYNLYPNFLPIGRITALKTFEPAVADEEFSLSIGEKIIALVAPEKT
ncbi:MAG: sodium:proton antiporter [Calditrichia bacterium]